MTHDREYICTCSLWNGIDLNPTQEIVRCKDCYWYIKSDVFKGKDCTHFSGLKTPNPDDYCSYAERRDDETD